LSSSCSTLRKISDLQRDLSYYDLLEVESDVPRIKIREAFLRLKKTYSSQSQALYSLMNDGAAKTSLSEIEEAYRTLDDEMLRREYDKKINIAQKADYCLSVERDPFGAEQPPPPVKDNWVGDINECTLQKPKTGGPTAKEVRDYPVLNKVARGVDEVDKKQQIIDLLEGRDPGDGLLYRELREMVRVDMNELLGRTKIAPEYVRAIENNSFHKLPALVYVKGFLKSYLQYLGIEDYQPYMNAFTEKLELWRQENET